MQDLFYFLPNITENFLNCEAVKKWNCDSLNVFVR